MPRGRYARLLRQPHQFGTETTPIFCITRARWVLIVRSETPSSAPISLLSSPAITWRQLRKPRPDFHYLAAFPAFLGRTRHRLLHGGEQFVVHKRFWQIIDRPAFHHTDPRWYIAVSGDEHDLLDPAFLRELPLEGQAVESRQLHV